MLKTILSTAFAAGLLAAPAFAQTTPTSPGSSATPAGTARTSADCEGNFNTADADRNGSLSSSEMTTAASVMPTSLSGKQNVTRQDFLSACNTNVQNQKGGNR